MSAYVIVDVVVHDHQRYEEYKRMTPESITAHGGRFVVRGGEVTVLEGDFKPGRTVIVEFPSVEAAKTWWGSAAYAPAKSLRQSIATTRMILVEGS